MVDPTIVYTYKVLLNYSKSTTPNMASRFRLRFLRLRRGRIRVNNRIPENATETLELKIRHSTDSSIAPAVVPSSPAGATVVGAREVVAF